MNRLVFLATALVAGSAAAKPLYITVPRAFGTNEQPTIDVAFAANESVQLNVTKPDDLDAFLRSQSNLRRAYTEPPVTVNPGRYLAKGLDEVSTPARFWRWALKEDFREIIAPSLPPIKADAPQEMHARLAETSPKLIGLPPGTSLVRSQWLNLDLGGSASSFTVPGFEEWKTEDSYQERRISIDPLPAGVYVLQLVQGRVEGQVVLLVTDLAVQVKQTDGEVLVRVAGRDQKPRAGAKVSVYLPNGAGPTGTTDDQGEVRLPTKAPRVLVTASVGSDTAVVDTDFYSTLAVTPDVFLYSDRPIYRPGDTVQFRGIVRQPDSFLARLFAPKHKTVSIDLVFDAKSDEHPATTATIDEFGSFSGKVAVPSEAEAGVVRVVAHVDDKDHESEARVREYVKPTFFVEILGDDETIKPGTKLEAKVRARRYAGGAAKDTAYEVALYRSLLDSPTWVDDSGLGGTGSAVTYGTASTTEGKLSTSERLYSSVENRSFDADEDPWDSADKFDDDGKATLSVDVPALKLGEESLPYRYSLSVFARDDQGTFANATKGYILSPTEVTGVVHADARLVMTGNDATLSVRSTTPSGRVFGEADGQVAFALVKADGSESKLSEQSFKTGADGVWRGPMPTKDPGEVLARVTLFDKQKHSWTGETHLLVAHGNDPVMQVPALTLESTGGVYKPGDTGEVVVLLPQGWGPGGENRGPLWVTLSGAGLYSSSLIQVDGLTYLHHFPIEKRFGGAVYVAVAYPTAVGRWEERTIPFRIVPPERQLSIQIQPARAEASPLGPQSIDLRVLDSSGRGVSAEVSVGVVDKAIYALQSEFRPGILDFFYPIVRDNVTSFYSSDFQGYGYGEVLAQLRGRLHPYEFAAIKPPTRKARDKDADTAYWNPSVRTDSEGRATVKFTMPSNQTLWTVTAVAADASGRFGEGTAEFASRGQLLLTTALPQFLRAGDEAEGSVRVALGAEKSAVSDVNVSLTVSGALTAVTSQSKISLGKDGEQLVPISLKATADGTGDVRLAATSAADPLKDHKQIAVRSSKVPDDVSVSSWGGGALALKLPEGAEVQTVQLDLLPGTVAAALASVRELVTYPYGCLEQLVATTVPNIAVYRTLEKVGGLTQLDADSRALLETARSRAVQGSSRILDLSLKSGGFTWFSGYSTPSAPLTLIALDGLAYAADAGLVDRHDGRLVSGEKWLAHQTLPQELEATRAYVLARLDRDKAAPNVRQYLDHVPSGDAYSAALAVLAAEASGIASEPAVKAQLVSLVQESADSLAKPAVWEPVSDFWGYPLRAVGLTAILTHAASVGDGHVDLDAARRRLLEALADPELSTFDRSTALLHSLWLLELDAKEIKTMAPPSVSGAGNVKLVPRAGGLEAMLDSGTKQVDVDHFGGVATLRAHFIVPVANLKPDSRGMTIERHYFTLRGSTRVRLQDGDKVSQGEDVYVELAVDAHDTDPAHSVRSAYYVVEDPIPAGFVALDEDKQYRGAPFSLPLMPEAVKRRTLGTERATFFLEEPAWWSNSPSSTGYVMRAQFPGHFSAPPATIEDMYVHAYRGRTAPETLTIAASGATKP